MTGWGTCRVVARPQPPVPTHTEKGQVTEYDPDSTETDRELE